MYSRVLLVAGLLLLVLLLLAVNDIVCPYSTKDRGTCVEEEHNSRPADPIFIHATTASKWKGPKEKSAKKERTETALDWIGEGGGYTVGVEWRRRTEGQTKWSDIAHTLLFALLLFLLLLLLLPPFHFCIAHTHTHTLYSSTSRLKDSLHCLPLFLILSSSHPAS